MHCLIDVRDEFVRNPYEYRLRKCQCRVDPEAPDRGAGCKCPACGAVCRLCSGFGGAPVRETPVRFSEVYAKVRAHRDRTRGPPPALPLDPMELACVEEKLDSEPAGHYVHRDVRRAGGKLYVLEVEVLLRPSRRLPVLR